MHFILAIHALFPGAVVHVVAAAPDSGLTNTTMQSLGLPLIDSAMVLIPVTVAISAIHKLMEHRETAMGVVVDVLVKGGAAALTLQLLKTAAGI